MDTAGPRLALLGLGSLLAAAGNLPAQELTYFGAVQYSSSSYVFTETTRSFYLYSGLALRAGRIGLAAGLPLVLQNSGSVAYVGGNSGLFGGGQAGGSPVPTGGEDHGALRGRRSGQRIPVTHRGEYELDMADPLLRGSLELVRSDGPLASLALDLQAKAPVADVESGVGTGEWDVGAGLSALLGRGATSVFADLAYWRYGDLPELELQDGLAYGLGVGRSFAEARWSVLGSLAGYTEIIEGVDPPVSVAVLAARRFSPGRTLSAGLGIGLTESASDISLLLGWRLRLSSER